VQEGDVVAARAGARRLVDESNTGRLQRGERRRKIFHRESDVVKARPAAGQEAVERGISARGTELQRRIFLAAALRMQEGDVGGLRRDVLAGAGLEPEERAQGGGGGVTLRNRDGDVIDALDLDHLFGEGEVAAWGGERARTIYQGGARWKVDCGKGGDKIRRMLTTARQRLWLPGPASRAGGRLL